MSVGIACQAQLKRRLVWTGDIRYCPNNAKTKTPKGTPVCHVHWASQSRLEEQENR